MKTKRNIVKVFFVLCLIAFIGFWVVEIIAYINLSRATDGHAAYAAYSQSLDVGFYGMFIAIISALGAILSWLYLGSTRPVKHLIDCNAVPFIPEGYSLIKQQPRGSRKLDLKKVWLYSYPKQEEKMFTVEDLLSGLLEFEKPALNANVMDYLFEHPELIPKEWKDKTILFLGTIFRGAGNCSSIGLLSWNGSNWLRRYGWVIDNVDINCNVAFAD